MDHSIHLQTYDSPLGRWIQGNWNPPGLESIVERIWYFEGMIDARRERVFPTGRAELIVHVGPPYRSVTESSAFSAVNANGLMLRPEIIEGPNVHSVVMGMRFHPAGMFAVFGPPVQDMTDVTIDAADLMPHAARELEERCAAAGSAERRMMIAAEWVRQRIRSNVESAPVVAWATKEIDRSRGQLAIAELIEASGYSRTNFIQTFRRHTGVPPKVYARLARFQYAMDLLRNGNEAIAGVAVESGFYDQSHLTAEFSALAGMTPGVFRQASRYPDSINLVEPAHG